MRWKKPVVEECDQRIVRRFLWWPRTIDGESRWLEFAKIRQRYLFENWLDEVWVADFPSREEWVDSARDFKGCEREEEKGISKMNDTLMRRDRAAFREWIYSVAEKSGELDRVESPNEEGRVIFANAAQCTHTENKVKGVLAWGEVVSDPGGKQSVAEWAEKNLRPGECVEFRSDGIVVPPAEQPET